MYVYCHNSAIQAANVLDISHRTNSSVPRSRSSADCYHPRLNEIRAQLQQHQRQPIPSTKEQEIYLKL